MPGPYTFQWHGRCNAGRVQTRKTLRLRHFDYRRSGAYFVTICASDRTRTGRERFGKIRPAAWQPHPRVFVPNDVGEVVSDCWIDIPGHFPTVMVDEFALLPNHFHGILFIEGAANHLSSGFVAPSWLRVDETHNGRARVDLDPPDAEETVRSTRPPLLSTVIGSFKSATARMSASARPAGKLWQRGFYDRVVRDQIALDAFRRYITANTTRHV
jgi:hypothetical protein